MKQVQSKWLRKELCLDPKGLVIWPYLRKETLLDLIVSFLILKESWTNDIEQ